MTKSTTAILLGAIAAFSVSTLAYSANPNFGERAVRQINSEGFRSCKAVGNSGYTASAAGILSGGSTRGSGKFRIRTCFQTRSQCEAFLARIPILIGKIDVIRHRTCKAR